MWGRMLHKIRGGQHTKVSKVRLTNQRRGFFALRVMAHCYGRLLKAPVLNGIKTLICGLLTALSFLQKPQKEIETASPKSCHSLWHLHFEQSCLQTCVSTCHLGNHVPRIIGQIHSSEVATRHLPGHPAWTHKNWSVLNHKRNRRQPEQGTRNPRFEAIGCAHPHLLLIYLVTLYTYPVLRFHTPQRWLVKSYSSYLQSCCW